ncbi:glycosyl transferase family 1 [Flavobacterium psychrophilum]|uniref:Glycosyl transferase WbsE n=6 Tax=Flavobacterium psychrophilum TaxID=96345 RepID=A6H0Q7_FLAPJ|nr:glycosyltransferase [Flavobacterium psychrophilum]AIG30615.1 glycosyl transferase family 1 [Flavobacterium psychrophilum]AIG32890.1 glycosyl transferase family 1 [Flavobacterium psychrophilum]AIG35045.1 glycosyl transferase family 1 [Flavobacterium psychrophilum]AIG37410.1 glycosyl transferase family 1 [Flavobacterium psychrophilum]AIG39674.1 glycosyl transferase family 1 [Flavobacterium psychrophilum]
MKILLVGEYSRLHNTLKEGLEKLGHQVFVNGLNDGFKDYPVDFKIYRKYNKGIISKIKNLVFVLTGFDISSYATYNQVKHNASRFSGFDVVQLINENSFMCQPKHEIKIIAFLVKNNTKLFLLSCGDDYVNVDYNFKNPYRKSVLNPYFEQSSIKKNFVNSLKFRKKSFKKLHEYIYENCNGVIATDFDYHLPLLKNSKYLGLIPNPINSTHLKYINLAITDKIMIFLGLNNQNYYKKGGNHFEEALSIIKAKYSEKVAIIITQNIPYSTYINLYNNCHILLDQTYANDQGYNALEAMAKGKVVFTGAEKEFSDYYNIQERVCINAKPDINYLVNELSFLIENPKEILAISKRAKAFVEKEHNYIKIAERYLEVWSNN